MIILMYILGNIPRKLSCGRPSVWKVLSKWHSHFNYYLFSLFETMPFGFLYQERLVVSFIYTRVDRGNLDGSFVLKP